MDSTDLELDHLLIWVAIDAPEQDELVKAGFKLDDEVNLHHGQGTASLTFSLENAYLELIWITDEAVAVQAGQAIQTDLIARSQWRATGACPFGIALRRKTASTESLPFAVHPFHAEWMRENDMVLFSDSASNLSAPLIFVIPPVMDWAMNNILIPRKLFWMKI